MASTTVRRIVAEFSARNKAKGEMAGFRRDMDRTRLGMKRMATGALQLAGVGGGLYMLQSVIRGSVREFVSFEKQLGKISTMLEEHTMRYLPQYGAELRKMSVKYGESMESLTEGLYDLLSAEIDASKAMKVLDVTVRSAKGGFTQANITTAATIRLLEGYNLEAKEAARINDMLHATVRKGITDFEGLGGSIGDVAGIAGLLDIEMAALLATLATISKTLKIDKAVMSLKNMLMTFKNPTAEATLAAEQLGFALDETSLKGKGLVTIIEKLNKANAQQLEALMPNLRGFVGLATAFKNVAAVSANYEFITKRTGLAEENLAKAMNNTSFALDKSKAHWDELKRTVGEEIAPALNALLPIFDKIVSHLKYLNSSATMVRQYTQYITGAREAPMEEFGAFKGGQGGAFRGKGATGTWDAAVEQAKGGPAALTTAEAAAARKRVQITARMYQEMGEYGQGYREARMAQLDMQKAEYGQHVQDKNALDRWYNDQKAKLDAEMAARNMTMWDKIAEFAKQKQAEMTLANEYAMGNMFYNMMTDAENWRDHLRNYFKDVASAFARMIAQMIARAMTWAIVKAATGQGPKDKEGQSQGFGQYVFSGNVMHGGGVVGKGSYPSRWVPSEVVATAPRYKQGRSPIGSDEEVAVLHKGETVLPEGVQPVVVNINVSAIDGENTADFLLKNKRMITNLFMSSVSDNHPIRRL